METPSILTSSPLSAPNAFELAQKVFAHKSQRRRVLAELPVEEKYQHFLALQRMVYETCRAAGKPCPLPWELLLGQDGKSDSIP